MKKRTISILSALALLFSLAACSNQDVETTDGISAAQANTSYTGTVSAVSTSAITVSTDSGDVTIAWTEDTVFRREFGMEIQQPGEGMGGEMLPEKPDRRILRSGQSGWNAS